jgi:hypothetical protein
MRQQIGHAGSGEAAFPEKVAGRLDQAVAGRQKLRHKEIVARFSIL